ncbi:MAG: glycerophosphodiester phosphodiesterase [Bacteroidetes bacterium]|nr:glycerophosphodiester phosphodiesterase [Bacteroidota bacterium]
MVEIFGHRGARGYFPENTLTGFIEAVKMGVHWLELDVVISKDKKVVVSHEPWMNSKFCLMPDGSPVKKRRKFNLHKMNYEEIKKFDCGKKTNKDFPKQKSISSYKPLLSEVMDGVDSFTKENNLPLIKYCIEIKSFKLFENKFQPPVKEFCELVYEVIKEKNMQERAMVISFDKRVLQHFQKSDSKIKTGFTFVNLFSVKTNLKRLGFTPYSFNPYYKLVSKKMIEQTHESGIKIIAWTVNKEKSIARMINSGVDGIMSDYPDVALKANKLSLFPSLCKERDVRRTG